MQSRSTTGGTSAIHDWQSWDPRSKICNGMAAFALVVLLAQLTSPDIDRALTIARSSDQQRRDFHASYIVPVDGPPVDRIFAIAHVEVITEFRRMELVGERQVLLGNHTFGRGGTRDAEEALRPWRERLSVVVQIRIVPTTAYVAAVPDLEVVLHTPEPGLVRPIDVRRAGIYSGGGGEGSALVGATVEGIFESDDRRKAAGIVVTWRGKEVLRVPFDFSAVE